MHRSRLAVALAMTVAALPILVLDNLPATADTDHHVEVSTTGQEVEEPSTVQAIETTTTTAAPTTTAAVAPVESPTTIEALEPTTTAVPRLALSAPSAIAATPPTTAPTPQRIVGDPADPATWDELAQCEAGGDWAANTGNGYYGGLQFMLSTWESYGGVGYPHEASREAQIEIGQRLQAARGWDAWPSCTRELGYR